MLHIPAHKQLNPRALPAQIPAEDINPARPSMDSYRACGVVEGFLEPVDLDEYVEAWQYLIDTGLAWRLQGWYGRNAQSMIDNGHCHH